MTASQIRTELLEFLGPPTDAPGPWDKLISAGMCILGLLSWPIGALVGPALEWLLTLALQAFFGWARWYG